MALSSIEKTLGRAAARCRASTCRITPDGGNPRGRRPPQRTRDLISEAVTDVIARLAADRVCCEAVSIQPIIYNLILACGCHRASRREQAPKRWDAVAAAIPYRLHTCHRTRVQAGSN